MGMGRIQKVHTETNLFWMLAILNRLADFNYYGSISHKWERMRQFTVPFI